ncbi:MAG: hypothetical protein BWY72_01734 [Bacteroidetes bacterium ADurb.Bin416]|nr:MAG: hypothetical protein BWY72_01734 [Bacteroidetes bacterium ADurb.Bin416]
MYLPAFQKAGEVKAVGDTAPGGQVDHGFHHVAAAGHDEAHIVCFLQDLMSGFHKVFGTFLHGDASQKGHDFIGGVAMGFDGQDFFAGGLHGVVDGDHLGGRLVVFGDDGLSGQVAHTNNFVGVVHAVFFDAVHLRIHLAPAAVEIGGVDMYHQGFAADVAGVYPGGVGKPVV